MLFFIVCCSIVLVASCLLYKILCALNVSIDELRIVDAGIPLPDCILQAVTVHCGQWNWMPTLCRVYFVGIIETIYITVCKRILPDRVFNQKTKTGNTAVVGDSASSFVNLPVAVIVGADSGIGVEICSELLKNGFRVIVGSRSLKACHDALTFVKKATESDKLHILKVDFTSFQSVRNFADKVKLYLQDKRIRLLINNAGVMNTPFSTTIDGYESQCQINYLAPFLLTKLLLPSMDTMEGRILFASSSTIYAINNLDTNMPIRKYGLNGLDHYAYSKACIAQLAKHMSRTTPIKVFVYHPGTVRTKLFQHTTIFTLPLLSKIFDFIMLSPKEGAETPLYLCLTRDNVESGAYWANKHNYHIPSVTINNLWDRTDLLWEDTMLKCGLTRHE
ncbi:hypothetical protein BDF20DRAFT_900203 [Mycotypha africana]|uniref:uncharacterized protein n=1 Tax=Mycotypha africana TaxID=64632 RepID=UPI002301D174|nr:uncharacterized protein BDF20DRAFT_900203 [Mycotypha africana]KAI8967590.1 hypothetical protein BDF20DRAFT_900203 [Mycotypha africana]